MGGDGQLVEGDKEIVRSDSVFDRNSLERTRECQVSFIKR